MKAIYEKSIMFYRFKIYKGYLLNKLMDRNLTIYRGKDEEREVCRKLDYFIPENMLRNERICLEEYDKYNAIYESLTKGKSVEPVVLKLKIDGKWDYNKLHI